MRTFLIDDDFISLYVAEHVLRLEAFAADIQLFTTGEAALSALAAHLPSSALKAAAGAAERGTILPVPLFLAIRGWQEM
jgi:hypothetical protein